jgi:polar amino acid transport system substrate-binding protein
MRRAVLASLLALACGMAAAAGDVRPLLTVVGDHAPPFRIFDAQAPHGIYFDLVRALAGRVGCAVRFVEVPSTRALAMMRSGEADLMIGLLQTPERAAYLHYLAPSLPAVDKRFLLRPGSRGITHYDDLLPLTIGVERGKSYSPQLDYDAQLTKDASDSYLIALRKLQAGRVDTVVMPEAEADWLMRETGLRFDKAEFVIEGLPTYITLSRASPRAHLQPQIERVLREMTANKEVAAFAARYR